MIKNNQSDPFSATLPYPHKNVQRVEDFSKRMQMEVARIMPRTQFIDLRQLVKTSIKFDIKYASTDNFVEIAFYIWYSYASSTRSRPWTDASE